MTTSVQMPEYQCHKKVHALKIQEVHKNDNGAILIWVEDHIYAPIQVDVDFITKHDPKAGGYYVIYKDGYKSFSPAEAFESGYTRI